MDANQHRGGLAARVERIWPDSDLLTRLGGRETLGRVVEGLYSRIESDPELRPLFGNEVGGDRTRQKMFFEEWMGGEKRYSQQVEGLGTRLFHYRFAITRRTAGRWLSHMTEALRAEGVEAALVREILRVLGPMAHALKYEDGPPLPQEIRVGLDLAKLEDWAGRDPEVFKRCRGNSQRLFLKAILRGRFDVVRLLVEHGVDVNVPFLHRDLMMTPWCVARHQGQGEMADYFIEQGARVDIFSAAFLGELTTVAALLDVDPTLADAEDPAVDHLAITPLHHAIRGGHLEVARMLLERGATVHANSILLLRDLAEKHRMDLVRLLLEHGASAAYLGPGRWVLGAELADLLLEHGAVVNQPAGDWLRFCTAHLSQRDEPDLIAALIDRGVDLSAMFTGQTALHLAANAGHLGTLQVLLDKGMDVDVEDANGTTALSYAVWARKKADRVATARILLAGGADRRHRNHKGETPLDHVRRAPRGSSRALLDLFEEQMV